MIGKTEHTLLESDAKTKVSGIKKKGFHCVVDSLSHRSNYYRGVIYHFIRKTFKSKKGTN